MEGRGREAARILMAAAEKAGVDPTVIRTVHKGYLVPTEVVDAIDDGPAKETKGKTARKTAEAAPADADTSKEE